MRTAQFVDQFGGRIIAFNPYFADIGGGVIPGLFLSQAFYWQKVSEPGNWWWKTRDEWTAETRLTRRQQEKARQRLKEAEVLEEELRGSPPKMHYKVRVDKLMRALGIRCDDPEDDVSPEEFNRYGCAQLIGTDAPNQKVHIRPNNHHQSTSESTSERCPPSTSEGVAGEGELAEDTGDCHPAMKAVRDANLGTSRIPGGGSRASRKVRTGGLRGKRGKTDPNSLAAINDEADRDNRRADLGGPRNRASRAATASVTRDLPPEGEGFAAVASWASERIRATQAEGGGTRPPDDWTGLNLLRFLGDLVECHLQADPPAQTGKAKSQAKDLLKAIGGDDAKLVIEYLVENWETFARDHKLDAAAPSISIARGFVDKIRALAKGHKPPGKLSGSDRDTGNWDQEKVSGW